MTEKITDSGWLGIGSGEELKTTDLGVADESITGPIADAYLAGVDLIKEAAEVLGISAAEFNAATTEWSTTFSKLNFDGKTPEEITEMITV